MFPFAKRNRFGAWITGEQRLDVHFRFMKLWDIPVALDIENDAFEFPWSEEDFVRHLRQHHCLCAGMVAESKASGDKGRVVAFMIYELHQTRLHLLNFAVAPGYRRQEVGTQMTDELIKQLSPHRRTSITLEVREYNLPAQLFFHTQGFRAVLVLRDFYEDTPEDAYVMEYRYCPPVAQIEIPGQARLWRRS